MHTCIAFFFRAASLEITLVVNFSCIYTFLANLLLYITKSPVLLDESSRRPEAMTNEFSLAVSSRIVHSHQNYKSRDPFSRNIEFQRTAIYFKQAGSVHLNGHYANKRNN